MAKFFGKIGYVQTTEERPGIFKTQTIEKECFGDMNRIRRNLQGGNQINDNITLANELSIIADPFAMNNFQNIRYVEYMGTKWKVSSVEVQYPRLILSMGEVYNGED